MDPLDKVLSVLIKKLGTALQDEKEKKGRDKEEHWGNQTANTGIKAEQTDLSYCITTTTTVRYFTR